MKKFLLLLLLFPSVAFADIASTILGTEASNLKGYWKCNENSGSSTLADSSGNSNTLTISGTSGTNYFLGEQGASGTCFRTDGSAGYASRTSSVIGNLDSQDFTMFGFIKGDTTFGSTFAFGIANSASSSNNRVAVGESGATTAASAIVHGNSAVLNSAITGGAPFDGTWHSIAFKRSGTAFTVYVDGVIVNSATATLATGSTSNRTSIMHSLHNGSTVYAKGSIQHVAMWNKALTDIEILNIHNSAYATESTDEIRLGGKSHLVLAPSWLNTGSDKLWYVSSLGIWSPVTIGSNVTFSGGTLSASSAPSLTFTGDVTGSGSPTIALTISANAVTLADMATLAQGNVLGRASTAGTGNVTALGALPWAFTGDVTRPADSNVTAIAPLAVTTADLAGNAVTFAKLQNSATNESVIGRPTNTAGNFSEIGLGASQILGRGATGDIGAISLSGNLKITGGTFDFNATTGSSTTTVLATNPTITSLQVVQGSNLSAVAALYGTRFTDTSPVGHLELFQNAAASSNLWDVDVTGTLQSGSIPEARISYTNPGANTIRVWDNTDGAMKDATIGANLTYTHSTHTLSATGGGGGTIASTTKLLKGDNAGNAVAATAGDITDGVASLLVKPAVSVVADSNISSLSGEQTIDGVTTSSSLVLATAQSTASQNGPWVTASGSWTRPTWYTSGSTTQAPQFLTTFVRLGTTYQGSTWRMTTASVTIDTTSTTWVQTPTNVNSVTGTIPSGNVPTLNQNTTGSAAKWTTARNLWGQSVDGSAAVGGSIQLGTAGTSDTVLDRSSAGIASVAGVAVPTISSTHTLTNKRVTLRSGTTTSSATPSINTDNVDIYTITALATNITSMTTNLTGTPNEGDRLIIWIKDNGTARTITWGASFGAIQSVTLPTSTIINKYMYEVFIYNATAAIWICTGTGVY